MFWKGRPVNVEGARAELERRGWVLEHVSLTTSWRILRIGAWVPLTRENYLTFADLCEWAIVFGCMHEPKLKSLRERLVDMGFGYGLREGAF